MFNRGCEILRVKRRLSCDLTFSTGLNLKIERWNDSTMNRKFLPANRPPVSLSYLKKFQILNLLSF